MYEKQNARPWQIVQIGNHVEHSSNLVPFRAESIASSGKQHAPCGMASAEPPLKILPVRVSRELHNREMTAAGELPFKTCDHESVRLAVSEKNPEGILSVEDRVRFLSDLLICR
jgi:hypothetical protein